MSLEKPKTVKLTHNSKQWIDKLVVNWSCAHAFYAKLWRRSLICGLTKFEPRRIEVERPSSASYARPSRDSHRSRFSKILFSNLAHFCLNAHLKKQYYRI